MRGVELAAPGPAALRLSGADLDREEVGLDLKMTQNEMALLLGTSRPKISVALSALEDQGALRRVGEHLRCRPDALMDVVGASEV